MNELVYWIWLQQAMGCAKPVKELLKTFKTAKEIYEADAETLKKSGVRILTANKVNRMKSVTLEKPEEILSFCQKHGIHIITPDSEFYPKRLLDTDNYPLVLYVRGDCTCLNDDAIAVIGSRTASLYGENAAKEIVKTLCENNHLIVSGGAIGIDTIAHRTALENGAKTVLVMGCGHGFNYLPENSPLRKAVSKCGALITEYPPKTEVNHGTFPQRNRIISGMSKGVVIVEAAEYSGTFSTAKHALKQKRDLFVLPGDIESGNFTGSNNLINEGATPVFSGNNILEFYGEKEKPKSVFKIKTGNPFENIDVDASSTKKKSSRKRKITCDEVEEVTAEDKKEEKIVKIDPESISKNALMVYNIMSDGINELDGIVRASSLDVRKVLIALTELEMNGVVCPDGPNKYRLVK